MSKIRIKNKEFDVLVAVTPKEKEIGLMWKSWPPPPMIFPFKKAATNKFWMKNTPSPLDIIFCKDNKIVSICQGEPNSTTMVGPDQLTDLVIELPRGTCRKYAIYEGDEVSLEYDAETAAKMLLTG